jgi:hypothetical protein
MIKIKLSNTHSSLSLVMSYGHFLDFFLPLPESMWSESNWLEVPGDIWFSGLYSGCPPKDAEVVMASILYCIELPILGGVEGY